MTVEGNAQTAFCNAYFSSAGQRFIYNAEHLVLYCVRVSILVWLCWEHREDCPPIFPTFQYLHCFKEPEDACVEWEGAPQ